VAVGDCAINGGVFAGSPDLVPNLAEALDVHVEIAGCPPAPEAILAALVEAAALLMESESSGDEAATDENQEPGDGETDDELDDDTEGRGE
jgi:Ni,Fe-hydrogenase III small subunit